mgnify:CR=1 FL=1
MTLERPFEGADFDRLSLGDMHALDLNTMLTSLAGFQRNFILSDIQVGTDKGLIEEWDNLALAAVELAETNDDLMKIDVFSRMGSEAKFEIERRLSEKRDVAA